MTNGLKRANDRRKKLCWVSKAAEKFQMFLSISTSPTQKATERRAK
jgi:hypothetical protein